jgi:hypothetical protein
VNDCLPCAAVKGFDGQVRLCYVSFSTFVGLLGNDGLVKRGYNGSLVISTTLLLFALSLSIVSRYMSEFQAGLRSA